MTIPSTMSAAVHDRYGDADVIRVDEVPVPTIAEDEVLVRVEAAGVDRGTWHLLTGQPYLVRLATGVRRPRMSRCSDATWPAQSSPPEKPCTGSQSATRCSGWQADRSPNTRRRRSGNSRPDPTRFPLQRRRCCLISGMTALQAVDAAQLRDGSTLLVIGASGGVGSYVVQIAHGMGARVTGVSRASKVDFVRSLGAERVVAYDDPGANPDGPYDAIIDTGGDTPLTRLRSMLAPRGTLVIVGGERGDAVTGMGRQLHARILSPFIGQRLTFIVNRERQADLERLARLVDDGTVKPALDTVFPLDQAADALRHLIAGHTQGKVAIALDPDQANHAPNKPDTPPG